MNNPNILLRYRTLSSFFKMSFLRTQTWANGIFFELLFAKAQAGSNRLSASLFLFSSNEA